MQLVKRVASSFVLLLSETFINDAKAGTKSVKINSIAKIIKAFFKTLPP